MYQLHHIISIISGDVFGPLSPESTIEHLLLDSRQVIFPSVSLFFAIKGTKHDGHQFINQAYSQGVRYFVISAPLPYSDFPEATFILVNDSLTALQKLATFHRHQFSLPCIGITGSNGKTIVKEWLFQLLRASYNIVRSPKSYNSQVGVPLSIWKIRSTHQLGIFEAGISEMDEMEHIAPIINCQIGIFTTIGAAHAAGFPSIQEKVRQKLKLFKHSDLLIYCKDYAIIHQEITALNLQTFSWSKNQSADLQIVGIKSQGAFQTNIIALYQQEQQSIVIPFKDDASIENAIHCWCVLLQFGFSNAHIQSKMQALEAVGMRLELLEGINGSTLINDSYNSDLNSLQIALDFLQQQGQQTSKRSLILSDILQSGQNQEALYQEVAALLIEKKIDRLVAVGQEVASIQGFLPSSIEFQSFSNTTSFLKALPGITFEKEAILLKGARQFQFERIADFLAQKVHQTVLEINLSALTHNLTVFHRYLQPKTKLMLMVKAAAYGSGSLEIARLAAFNQVDYLAVAYADEGVELRQNGIDLPILILNPEAAVFDKLIRHRLEPEIYSLSMLQQFAQRLTTLDAPFLIHIKLDTGMHRLGFEESDLSALVQLLNTLPQIKVASIFSHLAASEASEHDPFTLTQIDQFNRYYNFLSEGIGYYPDRHILNSSGIIRFPSHQMEMVRLGIGMYGIASDAQIEDSLRNVLQLKARISQIKTIKKGDTIGYGRVGKVEKEKRIATVSIGYADGLLRAAGNLKHHLYVNEIPAPIIGNICMDMCMIDISAIHDAKVGSEVIVFETIQQLKDLAKALHTIPYELLTNIALRVKRVYIQE